MLLVQKIEPSGKVAADGRMRALDRILAINQIELDGVDFLRAQEILRDAIRASALTHQLEFKLLRLPTEYPELTHNSREEEPILAIDDDGDDNGNDQENEERPIEYAPTSSGSDPNNKENINTNISSMTTVNLSTKRSGKRVSVELVKGNQGKFNVHIKVNTQGILTPIFFLHIMIDLGELCYKF